MNFHSRPYDDFDFSGDEHKVAFLTSPARGPEHIAKQLIGIDHGPFKICVLERLGDPDAEKFPGLTVLQSY